MKYEKRLLYNLLPCCLSLLFLLSGCAADSPSSPQQQTGGEITSLRVVATLSPDGYGTPNAAFADITGPVNRTLSLGRTAIGFEGIFSDVPVGAYRIVIRGTQDDLVSRFAAVNDVAVAENGTVTTQAALSPFVARMASPGAPTTAFEMEFAFDVVEYATSYVVETSGDRNFDSATMSTITDPNGTVTVAETGAVYVRVRASNADVPANSARPSDVVEFSVVTDITNSGDNAGTAPPLGNRTAANGVYDQLNIFPAGDEDWFAVDLQAGDRLTADILSSSIKPRSPLDSYVEIIAADGSPLATSDRANANTVESRLDGVTIPSNGRYFLRVMEGSPSSVGHYELRLAVLANSAASVDFELITAVHVQGPTGLSERGRSVIRDAETWQQFWEAVQSVVASPDAAPVIDFSKDMVIAATMGEKPTGGYFVAIEDVLDNDGIVTVRVIENNPAPTCYVTQELTAPVTAVIVPRSDGAVAFMDETRIVDCQ